MMKTTRKDIIELSQRYDVVDLTHSSPEEIDEIRQKESYFNPLAYSMGKYGGTALAFTGKNTRTIYTVTTRNSNFYRI